MSKPELPLSSHGSMIRSSIRRHVWLGFAVCVLLFAVFGGWAAYAELAGAVVATGKIVVESDSKKVQHPTGGVVGQLLVRDGQSVRENEVVIRLDETTTRANLEVVLRNLDQLEGRKARLEAERDEAAELEFPQSFIERAESEAEVHKIMAGEKRLFEARRIALEGQRAQLNERVVQMRNQISGVEAQLKARTEQRAVVRDELQKVQALYDGGFVALPRLTALQRETVQVEGDIGQLEANLAQLRGRIAELNLEIIQLGQNRRTEILKELRDDEGRIAELTQRRIAAEDQLKHIDIRAPQTGIVHRLAVHTVGGVIGGGEVLMLIVPEQDELVVEAQISPQDIDQVAIGQKAVVRFSAFNSRQTPEIDGAVSRVGADLSEDQRTGWSYYLARVEIPASELARLGDVKLIPGMPVEVHIQTSSRSALSYLTKPLMDQIGRAMKED